MKSKRYYAAIDFDGFAIYSEDEFELAKLNGDLAHRDLMLFDNLKDAKKYLRGCIAADMYRLETMKEELRAYKG